MKKRILIPLLAAGLLFTACKKDKTDDEPTVTNISLESTSGDATLNAAEDEPISLGTLKQGIEISSGSLEEGLPPAPSVDLGLEIPETDVQGFQETGFAIPFNTSEDIAGAYLRIKDTDGKYLDGYYDITELSNGGDSDFRVVSGRRKRKNLRTAYAEDNVIQVEFNEVIPAGTFCVEVCVYDYENNVGQIQTVCIEVEAWGGLENLANYYDAVSMVDIYDGETESETFTDGEWEIEMKSDGSYIEKFDNGSDIYYGKWAYNEEKKTLTTIDFKNVYSYDGVEEVEEYENGSLYFEDVTVTAIGNEMTWSLSEIDPYFTLESTVVFRAR